MGDVSPVARTLGYCTNVHAGASLDETLANLERHAAAVKRAVAPHGTLGIGLWLSARAAREVIEGGRAPELRDFLDERGLRVFTINGFPYGDFHERVVKHAVYAPDWYDQRRLRYTLDLADILAGLLGEGEEGSISTLPLGWPPDGARRVPARAAAHLKEVAARLERIEGDTGRLIHVDLEPEPGCEIDCADDVVAFFSEYLPERGASGKRDRRHVRVCHDVCHAAVMFEDQREVFAMYRDAGVRIGKVQVSSALRVDFAEHARDAWPPMLDELRAFAEDRYLHQTSICDGGSVYLLEDLPYALDEEIWRERGGEWRVHFHVPVYLERLGRLGTTQAAILECLELLGRVGDVRHFEVETYTWEAVPAALRPRTLAEGIARELRWLGEVAPGGFFA